MNRERGRTFDDSSRMKILLPQNVSKMKVYRESLMAYHSGHSHAHWGSKGSRRWEKEEKWSADKFIAWRYYDQNIEKDKADKLK